MDKKIIFISGGNRGIGLGIAKQLVALGHQVLIGSRDIQKGREVIKKVKGDIQVYQLDVTKEDEIKKVSTLIEEHFGKLDVLINNAGVFKGSDPSISIDLNLVRSILETNLYGAWQLTQNLLPLLRKSDDARVVNISSGMGATKDMVGGYAGYRISKSSLNMLTLMMANELRGEVVVNAMCPGWVRSDMGGPSAHRSIEEGADTAVWLSTIQNSPTGKFFRDRKEIPW